MEKLSKVLLYYVTLVRYVAHSSPKILHILWNNKFELFDRTILMLYYKALGKRVAFTAHNVNRAKRDAKDSWFNRVTLRIQYRLCDHIFVHTQKMKDELCRDFAVTEKGVTVIPFPINNASPNTELTSVEAKRTSCLRKTNGRSFSSEESGLQGHGVPARCFSVALGQEANELSVDHRRGTN